MEFEEEKTQENLPILSRRQTTEILPEDLARIVEWSESVTEEITMIIENPLPVPSRTQTKRFA